MIITKYINYFVLQLKYLLNIKWFYKHYEKGLNFYISFLVKGRQACSGCGQNFENKNIDGSRCIFFFCSS